MPIERQLRGKRFFITGATGFLGTALVERILRCIPEAEITVLIRPGRRADASARLAREVIKNDCFDRLRHELGDGFADEVAGRVRAVAGDVGQDGLGLDDEGRDALAGADVVIHSAATVSFDAPLTQAVEINLLGPSRVAAAMAECGSNGAPHRGVDRLRREHAPGRGQGGAAQREPASPSTCAGRTRLRSAGACATTSRPSRASPTTSRSSRRRRGRSRCGRRPPDRLAGREAARGVGQRRAGEGGHRPCAVARLARRLPLHQGTRGEGARRAVGGQGPHHVRTAFDHRVGAVRTAGRLDPGFPDGGADHHLVRPRPARRVPGRARGHHRRDPGRPGGGGDPRGRGTRAGAREAEGVPRRLRRAEPAPLRTTGREGDGLLPAQPALRRSRPAHQRARVVVPRTRAGAAAAPPRRRAR